MSEVFRAKNDFYPSKEKAKAPVFFFIKKIKICYFEIIAILTVIYAIVSSAPYRRKSLHHIWQAYLTRYNRALYQDDFELE